MLRYFVAAIGFAVAGISGSGVHPKWIWQPQ
jgi:hypothetical protein